MATKFNIMERQNKFRWLKKSVQLGLNETIVKGKNFIEKIITIWNSAQ